MDNNVKNNILKLGVTMLTFVIGSVCSLLMGTFIASKIGGKK